MNDQSDGRVLHTTAYGDTAEEIEMDAASKGREFFGSGERLELSFQASGPLKPGVRLDAGDSRFAANVTIRAAAKTVEP